MTSTHHLNNPPDLIGKILKELVRDFTYLEVCALDAAIHDKDEWIHLRELTDVIESTTGMKRLEKRIERIRVFLVYLERIEQNWLVSCHRYKVEGFAETELIKGVVKPMAEEYFKIVVTRAERAFAKKRVRYQLSRE